MSLLAIGIVCLDEILQCPHYPVEDTLIHAHKSLRHKGGNAANSMGVLGQLAAYAHIEVSGMRAKATVNLNWGVFFSCSFS